MRSPEKILEPDLDMPIEPLMENYEYTDECTLLHVEDYSSHCDKPCEYVQKEGWPRACLRCIIEDPNYTQ